MPTETSDNTSSTSAIFSRISPSTSGVVDSSIASSLSPTSTRPGHVIHVPARIGILRRPILELDFDVLEAHDLERVREPPFGDRPEIGERRQLLEAELQLALVDLGQISDE